MKIAELLRGLADMVDSASGETQPKADGGIPPSYVSKQAGPPESISDLDQAPEVFLPPLQMQLELLKKATGVPYVLSGNTTQTFSCAATGATSWFYTLGPN